MLATGARWQFPTAKTPPFFNPLLSHSFCFRSNPLTVFINIQYGGFCVECTTSFEFIHTTSENGPEGVCGLCIKKLNAVDEATVVSLQVRFYWEWLSREKVLTVEQKYNQCLWCLLPARFLSLNPCGICKREMSGDPLFGQVMGGTLCEHLISLMILMILTCSNRDGTATIFSVLRTERHPDPRSHHANSSFLSTYPCPFISAN